MSDSGNPVQPSFSPDLAITSAAQDLLNRSSYAAAVAKAIGHWNQKSSLVIGLFGDWGSGKSSLKNMILECLAKGVTENERLSVVEFCPWQVSDPDHLSRAFFDEVEVALGRLRTGEAEADVAKRVAKWKAYGSHLSLGTSIIGSLKTILPLIGGPFGNQLAAAIELALKASVGVVKEGTEGLQASGQASIRTLAESKRQVSEALESLPHPLLVVLDDVDRLTQDEIRLLVQLIKANADFPNIIYLVLAQRDIVVRALEKMAPDSGEAFLEKIFQVGLTVPRIERRQLEKALFAGLNVFLTHKAVGQRFDKEHWGVLYRDGLRFFFDNLRDVNRFLSSFGFHVGVFQSSSSFEVNTVDLIAVEVLRVFVPSVHERLPDMKHILTDEPRFLREEERKQDENALKDLLESAPPDKKAAVRSILESLFPPAAAVLRGSHDSTDESDRVRNLRICSHDFFDRYFQFAVPSGDISQAELDAVISVIGDREALRKKFADLRRHGLIEVMLDRLDDYRSTLPIEDAPAFVSALFDLDVDAVDEFFALRLSPQTHLYRIVFGYLRQEPDQSKRKRILESALASTTGLATPVSFVGQLETKVSEAQVADPNALLERQADIDELRSRAVEMIKLAARSRRLAKEQQLRHLLSAWSAWGNGEEVRRWVADLTSEPDGFLTFLRALRGTQRSYGGSTPKLTHYFALSDLEEYVDLKTLKSLVDQIKERVFSADDADNVRLFKAAVARREQGKPDYRFPLFD